MDYQKREEIFSKEMISISDVMELVECSYSKAADLIGIWKKRLRYQGKTLRVEMDGKIHVLDYFDVMGIDYTNPGDRYRKQQEPSAVEPIPTAEQQLQITYNRRSVCC